MRYLTSIALRLAGAMGTLASGAEAAAPKIASPAPGSRLNGSTEMQA